jgi:hypothetical protein
MREKYMQAYGNQYEFMLDNNLMPNKATIREWPLSMRRLWRLGSFS